MATELQASDTPQGRGSTPGTSELALQGLALAFAAGGLAHQVRNPLNAMALQLALLAEKLGAAPGVLEACDGHLAKLQAQIARVEDAVRRYLDAADPDPGGAVEPARLLGLAVALFGHEARHRHATLEAGPVPAGLSGRGDGVRVQRLWLGLVWRALEEAGEGGAVRMTCGQAGPDLVLGVEHVAAIRSPLRPWVEEAIAAGAVEVGGRLEQAAEGTTLRAALHLPAVVR